jgi:hypothetical protein
MIQYMPNVERRHELDLDAAAVHDSRLLRNLCINPLVSLYCQWASSKLFLEHIKGIRKTALFTILRARSFRKLSYCEDPKQDLVKSAVSW